MSCEEASTDAMAPLAGMGLIRSGPPAVRARQRIRRLRLQAELPGVTASHGTRRCGHKMSHEEVYETVYRG